MVENPVDKQECTGVINFEDPIIILSERKVSFYTYDKINLSFLSYSPEEFREKCLVNINNGQNIRIVSKNLPCIHVQNEEDSLPSGLKPFQNRVVLKEKWAYDDIFCYFGIDNEVLKEWILLPNASVRHYSGVLHNYWLASNDVFAVDFDDNFVHIYCKKDGKFIFYNKLLFENEVDVHYILELIRQKIFSNDANITPVFSGKIDKGSKIIKPLQSYFDSIKFVNDYYNELVVNGKTIDSLYFDLYAISL